MAVCDMFALYFKLYVFFLMANFRLNMVLIEEKCHYLTASIPTLIVLVIYIIVYWLSPWALLWPDVGLQVIQLLASCVILGRQLHCSDPPFAHL